MSVAVATASGARATAAIAPSGAPYTATVLHRHADFLALEAEWRELHAAAERPFTWQRHRWLRLSWELVWRRPFNRLRIVLIRDRAGQLVMAGAFVLYFYRLVPTLQLLGSGTPQIDDVLWRPSGDTDAQATLLLDTLIRHRGGAPMLRIERIREDSPLLAAIAARGLRRRVKGKAIVAPHIPLSQHPDFDTYLGGLSQSLRSDHRRRLRRLAEIPGYRCGHEGGDAAREALRWSFDTKREWLERRGERAPWLVSGHVDRFATAFLESTDDVPETWIATMRFGGRIAASTITFVERDVAIFWKIAHDPEYAKHSPGRTLTLEEVRRAFDRGLAEFDLGQGTVEWKRRLTSEQRIVTSQRIWLS